MSFFSKKELAECAARELGMRRKVYPNWVRAGKMKQVEADRQINMMEQIYRVLIALSDKEIEEPQK